MMTFLEIFYKFWNSVTLKRIKSIGPPVLNQALDKIHLDCTAYPQKFHDFLLIEDLRVNFSLQVRIS